MKREKIDKIFSDKITALLLFVVFLLISTFIILLPKLIVAFAAMYAFFVVYAMYTNAKNKHEVKSGVLDTIIFKSDEEDIERHIK